MSIARKLLFVIALSVLPSVLVAAVEDRSAAVSDNCCDIAWCDGSSGNHCGTIFQPNQEPISCFGELSPSCAEGGG